MTTIKLKFRASAASESEGTLYYQVIHKRIVKWISTGYRIGQNEWDAKAGTLLIPSRRECNPQLSLMKAALDWELKQRKEVLCKLKNENKDFSLNELCEAFSRLPPCQTVFAFLREQISRQKRMERFGTAKTYTGTYRRFKEFRENMDLTFDELTQDMIEEYEAWLTNRNLKQNTIRFYLRTLNTLLHMAEGKGLLSDGKKLFCRVRLAYVITAKRAAAENEIRAIQKLSLPANSITAFARDIFMFSFYMRGMPFVDIAFLKKSSLKNGMLSYCRKKTNQQLVVAWEREQQEIVERYAQQTEGLPYLLPIIRGKNGTEYRQYQRVLENVNRALKKVGEMIGLKMPLTTYVARHSWASIARDMNIPLPIISEGMGHQSYKTTQVYIDSIDTSKVNAANREIIRKISKGQ